MIALTGCTTLRQITTNQPDFSQHIASGELLNARDHVTIETKDRQTYEFEITSISITAIDGKQHSVPIDQIVSIQKRVLNKKRTFLLVLLVAGGIVFTVALGQCLEGWGRGGSSRK